MSDKTKGYYLLSKNSEAKQPYHWVLKAPNHEIILVGENYSSKHAALNGIDSVREDCPVDSNYERNTASNGSPYFNLRDAKNHKIIGTSEMYSSIAMRDNGIEAVKKYGVTLILEDETELGSGVASTGAVITKRPEKNEQANRYA